MKIPVKSVVLAAGLALPAMASQCVSVTDPLVITVNVNDIQGAYAIPSGVQSFNSLCVTRSAGDYIDPRYNISGAHLVDLIVQTAGAFPGGNVNGGTVTINGTTLMTYHGSWNAFNTPQSVLTSNLLVKNSAGVQVLLDAIQNKGSVTLCHGGAFSQPAPSGLQVLVTIFAQASATP